MIIIKIMTIAMIIMIRSSPVSLISISPATPTCAAVLWAVSTLQHKYHDHGYDGHDLEDNGCSIKIPHSAYDDDEDAKVMIKCVVVGS